MQYIVEVNNKTTDEEIKKELFDLNLMYLKSNEKVAYYYEHILTGTVFSYNPNICFYAASSIKILVSLLVFTNAVKGDLDLESTLTITKDDLKRESRVTDTFVNDIKYTIRELIKRTIVESDNTAYIKLVNYVGKDRLIEFGKSLGATHTLEGVDLFGIVNCSDMKVYWKAINNFIDNESLGKELASYLSEPTVKLVDDDSIGNNKYLRKYGEYGIAYHEAGIVKDEWPFYLFIMTQKSQIEDKNEFVNDTAKRLYRIHNMIVRIKNEQ